jgi:hypothetical protein
MLAFRQHAKQAAAPVYLLRALRGARGVRARRVLGPGFRMAQRCCEAVGGGAAGAGTRAGHRRGTARSQC